MNLVTIRTAITTYWYRLRLKLNGVTVGVHSKFCGRLCFRINEDAEVSLGSHLIINGGCFINTMGLLHGSLITVWRGGNLVIGDYCGFSDISISVRDRCTIGRYVMIGGGTVINDSNDHCLDYILRRRERLGYSKIHDEIVSKPIHWCSLLYR